MPRKLNILKKIYNHDWFLVHTCNVHSKGITQTMIPTMTTRRMIGNNKDSANMNADKGRPANARATMGYYCRMYGMTIISLMNKDQMLGLSKGNCQKYFSGGHA